MDPIKYSTYTFYLNRISLDLGLEDKQILYYMWCGNVNTLLKVIPNPIIDQVIWYNLMTRCLANAYLNQRVRFNI